MRLKPILFALTALLSVSPSHTNARGFQPTVLETQFYLSLSGYYGGTLDGRCGSGTRDALIKYLTKAPVATAAASCEHRDLLKINKALRDQLVSQLNASGKKPASPEVGSNNGNTEDSKGAGRIQTETKLRDKLETSKDAPRKTSSGEDKLIADGEANSSKFEDIDSGIKRLNEALVISRASTSESMLSIVAVIVMLAALIAFLAILALSHCRCARANSNTSQHNDAQNPTPSSAATTSHEENIQRATALLRFGDRVRTIDQIKRLYAVVMGYAVGNCFTNASKIMQSDPKQFFNICGHMVCFLTLIVLFYLAAERLLDTRYLKIQKRLPPDKKLLLFDIVSLGGTALLFVIISNTLIDNTAVTEFRFAASLAALFLIDALLLFAQLMIITSERKANKRVLNGQESLWNMVMRAHFFWIATNIVFMIFLYPVVRKYFVSATEPKELARWYNENIFGKDFLKYGLPTLLTMRFLFDFLKYYSVYYPEEKLPDTDKLFLWS